MPIAACTTPLAGLLAQAKLEDVLKSAQDSMNQGPAPGRILALFLGAAALLILMALLQYRRHHQAVPKSINHQGRLLKEVTRTIPLKSSELRQLRQLAEEQSCSTPLVLLLCPSLLTRSAQNKPPEQKKVVDGLIRKLSNNA